MQVQLYLKIMEKMIFASILPKYYIVRQARGYWQQKLLTSFSGMKSFFWLHSQSFWLHFLTSFSGMTIEVDAQYPLRAFLPRNVGSFYRYDGSLTTPTCNEVVTWTVFDQAVPISEAQVSHGEVLMSIVFKFEGWTWNVFVRFETLESWESCLQVLPRNTFSWEKICLLKEMKFV